MKHDHVIIYLNDIQNRKEELISFISSKLSVNATTNHNTLTVKSETLSPQKLLQVVTKFLYHKNLNNAYWASIDSNNVKINKFEKHSKTEKTKTKNNTPHKTITQTWGLKKLASLIALLS